MAIVAKNEQLGKYAEDGSIEAWPVQNILGQSYEQVNATLQRVPGGFVVLPPDYKGDREITTQAAMVEPVKPAKRDSNG